MISAQQKIAELESRIAALEQALMKLAYEVGRREPLGTTSHLTSEQRVHWDGIWKHFDGLFVEMGKLFR